MPRRERHTTSPDAVRDLDALDRALDGETVEQEHVPIATLVQEMRAIKPAPSRDAALALDTRIGRLLRREPRGARRPGRSLRGVLSHPALAAAALAAVALAIAVPLALPGDGRSPGGHRGAAAATGASRTARPAPPASGIHGPAAGAAAAPFALQSRPASVAPSRQPAPAQGAASGEGPRQVERSAALDIGVAPASIQSTAQRVFALASSFHGYVQQSNVTATGGHGEQGGATFQLRLPSTSLTAALAAFARLGHVRSETDTTSDVTGQLNALKRYLHDAEARRSSLLAQLERTSEAGREEALKRRLRFVEAQISSRQRALEALRGRVQYTDVALSLTPEAHTSAATSYLTVGGALHDADRILMAALGVLVLVGAALLPVALLGLAGWVLMIVARRRLREQALDES